MISGVLSSVLSPCERKAPHFQVSLVLWKAIHLWPYSLSFFLVDSIAIDPGKPVYPMSISYVAGGHIK